VVERRRKKEEMLLLFFGLFGLCKFELRME
jgi:hypothetical protein